MSNNKPVVILAGWLGCHPRNLRRYNQLYNSLGWDTIVQIASPRSIVTSMSEGPSYSHPSSSEMQHLAINTLKELHVLQPPYFIIHIFSNGGCFLWECIRYILYEQDTSQQMSTTTHNNSIDISNLRQKLIGVIFDSAPGYYDGRIDDLQSALEYVSSNIERKDLLTMTKTLEQNVVRQRFAEFWNGLSNDSTNIPQLYLFSQCDNLASSKHIEMLIEYRKDEIGMKRKIWKHKFLDSDHCCHLLKYPQEYSKSIKEFLSFCIREGLDNDSFIKSRL